jgi:hypothetical protein
VSTSPAAEIDPLAVAPLAITPCAEAPEEKASASPIVARSAK